MKFKIVIIILAFFILPISTIASSSVATNFRQPLFENSKEIIELKKNLDYDLGEEWYDNKGNPLPIYNIKNVYSKIITYYDKNGNVSIVENTSVNQNEYYNETHSNYVNNPQIKASVISCSSLDMYKDCIETNYKVLTIAFLGNPTYPNIKVAIINRWKKMPKIRSYDVIGMLMESSTFNMSSAYGYQYYNESGSSGNLRINYSYQGTNMKLYKDQSKKELGVSISQNLLNSAETLLRNELYVVGVDIPTNNDPFGVTASYQHSTEYIDLVDSKNFEFNFDGMGRVFKWKNNVQYWDNMEGVCGRLDSTNIL